LVEFVPGPTVSTLFVKLTTGTTFVFTVPEVSTPVVPLYEGTGTVTVKFIPTDGVTVARPWPATVGTGTAMALVAGPTVRMLPVIFSAGAMCVVDVPVVRTPVAGLYTGGGMLILKLFGARLVTPAAATFVVTATLAGITCRLYAGPVGFKVAAPVAISVVAGVEGIEMLLVEGPTVSTPLLKPSVGVTLVVALPVVRIPVAALYCGGGMLILKLFGATLVTPAAATLVVTATLAGIT
jgi:hypothetical protein